MYTYAGDGSIKDNNYCLVEYRIPDESNDTLLFELTDVEYTWDGQKISHKDHCRTCIEGTEPSDYAGWRQLIHFHADNYPE